MKKVLIFSLTYYPYVGGAEVALREITNRIDSKDYEFDMITLRFDRNLPRVEKMGNITVHRIGFTDDNPVITDKVSYKLQLAKILSPFSFFFKAWSLHRKNKYDMTWAMMANYSAFGAMFFRYAFPRVKYLLTLQDGRELDRLQKRQPILIPLHFLYKQVFLKADLIQVISTFLSKWARSIGYTGSIELVPNAVNTKQFSQGVSREDIETTEAELTKKEGEILLIHTGRLEPYRGVEHIITALTMLPDNVRLIAVGPDGRAGELKEMAQELGVSERIHFVGYVDLVEVPRYLHTCDIFVRCPTVEGFGNSFVEAMAAGIPVVATPIGGIPDYLYDPERNPDEEGNLVEKSPEFPPTGYFCEVRNPESVAEAVKRVLDNPTQAEEITKNAKAMVIERYDWDLIAKDMQEKVLDKLTH